MNQSGSPIPLQPAEFRPAVRIIRIFQPEPRSANIPNRTHLMIFWKPLDRFAVERRFVLHS